MVDCGHHPHLTPLMPGAASECPGWRRGSLCSGHTRALRAPHLGGTHRKHIQESDKDVGRLNHFCRRPSVNGMRMLGLERNRLKDTVILSSCPKGHSGSARVHSPRAHVGPAGGIIKETEDCVVGDVVAAPALEEIKQEWMAVASRLHRELGLASSEHTSCPEIPLPCGAHLPCPRPGVVTLAHSPSGKNLLPCSFSLLLSVLCLQSSSSGSCVLLPSRPVTLEPAGPLERAAL